MRIKWTKNKSFTLKDNDKSLFREQSYCYVPYHHPKPTMTLIYLKYNSNY